MSDDSLPTTIIVSLLLCSGYSKCVGAEMQQCSCNSHLTVRATRTVYCEIYCCHYCFLSWRSKGKPAMAPSSLAIDFYPHPTKKLTWYTQILRNILNWPPSRMSGSATLLWPHRKMSGSATGFL